MKRLHLLCLLVSLATFGYSQSTVQQIKGPQEEPAVVEYKDWDFNIPSDYLQKIQQPRVAQSLQVQPIHIHQAIVKEHMGLEVLESADTRPTLIKANDRYEHPTTKSVQGNISAFLRQASALLDISAADQAFVLLSTEVDKFGTEHHHMQHIYEGVPVFGSEVILHGKEGKINSLNGRYLSHPEGIEISPSMDLATSQQELIDRIGILEVDSDPYGIFDFEKLKSELILYPTEQGYKLAYHHTVYPEVGQRWEYFVDANSGIVLHFYESICRLHNHTFSKHLDTDTDSRNHKCTHEHSPVDSREKANVMDGPLLVPGQDLFGRNINVQSYSVNDVTFMIDASKANIFNTTQSNMPDEPVGAIWTIDGNNRPYDQREWAHVATQASSWSGKAAEVSAHVNGSAAFDYFEEKFDRRSINGRGGNIISIVNILDPDGSGLDNAFWDGQFMYYGSGRSTFLPLARGLDVAAHEMSHGVIQNTANLLYEGQSGSLNESFADIFGAMVDREDWLIGEDVIRPDIVSPNQYPLGALRSMEDPNNGINDATVTYQTVGKGWQPKHMDEFFDDVQNLNRGGVHINSGIPNHAYYLFANEVGKDVAEQVYYLALTQYLTRSSQFVDARVAVLQAAEQFNDPAIVTAAANAWAAVGIGDGGSSNPPSESVCEDLEANPGSDFVVVSDRNLQQLDLFDGQGNWLTQQAPLSTVAPLSRPSVTDDGNSIFYVGTDNRIYVISFDWTQGSFERSTFQDDPTWRNAVVSKDGRLIAATTTAQDNRVIIYDFVTDTQQSFFLYNPTFTQGVDGGDVVYSDAMEFDHAGETLLYDAFNRIEGASGAIEFWDIGLMRVWDRQNNTFGDGDIQKLFTGLSEGESVGNPTFSKNSPCVIAFDYIDVSSGQPLYSLWAVNIEQQELGVLYENSVLSWPSYSTNDQQLVHDINLLGDTDLGVLNLQSNKIETVPNTEDFFVQGARRGVWFSNGQRDLFSDLTEVTLPKASFIVTPNPTTGIVTLTLEVEASETVHVSVKNLMGTTVSASQYQLTTGRNHIDLDLTAQPAGQYAVIVQSAAKSKSQVIIKVD